MNVFAARALCLAVLPLLLGAKGSAPAPAPGADLHRGIEWPGAAGFFKLGSMTVVYPAGPGEPADLNRRSAESRARWLAAVHNNKVAVAADDQLTEEQKKGNLLLLGWNNRVLGAGTSAGHANRPYVHDQTGTTFLGIHEPDPKVDLLVYHRNPLSWGSFVLIWTRIDPERDRLQVLPRIGSDWAMYRDYHAVRQGMFLPKQVWPPARDTLAEADRTSDALLRPGGTASVDSEHYHVVFDRAKFKDSDVKSILQAREAAFSQAVEAIGPAPKGFRILFFIYDNDSDKQEATGVVDPAHEVPGNREIHATRRYALAASPRQELRILAREAFGPCFLTAVCEGLALSYVNTWHGQDLDINAAMLRSANRLPAPEVLLDEERLRKLPADDAAIGAGVLMTWVRQTYGPAGLKKIYGLEGGFDAAADALGTSEKDLAGSFTAWADALAVSRKNDIDFLGAEAEAQRLRVSSDWKGMAAALQKALKARPGDLQTLFNLASAQMRDDQLAAAEASLKTILAAPIGPKDSRFVIFGHYQLGRVYDLAGRRDAAIAEYDAVLALPDDHGAHALARERKTSPATREQLE